MKYKRLEDDIRNQIIEKFINKGIKIKRLENSIGGRRNKSFPDLWFFDPMTRVAGWMEVKSLTGRLSTGKDSQTEFRGLCLFCNVNHWVVRSVDEALAVTGRVEHDTKRLKEIEF